MDSLRALVFAAAVARAADAVEAAQANTPQLLLDDVHDGRAIFAWAVDYVEKVPLDADGRCFVVLPVRPRVDVRNERHVDPRDLETVARETLAAWRALV